MSAPMMFLIFTLFATVAGFAPVAPVARLAMGRLASQPRMSAEEAAMECIYEAENAAEAEECIVPVPEPSTPSKASRRKSMKISGGDKRAILMGPADSLQSCLAETENAMEVEECNLDYEELITGPGPSQDQLLDNAPAVVAGLAAVIAAGVFFGA